MILCCSTPMIPGATLTEKAELLKTWGYQAIAIFQPYRGAVNLERSPGGDPDQTLPAAAKVLRALGGAV